MVKFYLFFSALQNWVLGDLFRLLHFHEELFGLWFSTEFCSWFSTYAENMLKYMTHVSVAEDFAGGKKKCTWKHRRRASSPREFLRLENPHNISLMSTVPSRLLSNRSKIRGAKGTSDDIFIAFSTSSNSVRVALSPFAHLHSNRHPIRLCKIVSNNRAQCLESSWYSLA